MRALGIKILFKGFIRKRFRRINTDLNKSTFLFDVNEFVEVLLVRYVVGSRIIGHIIREKEVIVTLQLSYTGDKVAISNITRLFGLINT